MDPDRSNRVVIAAIVGGALLIGLVVSLRGGDSEGETAPTTVTGEAPFTTETTTAPTPTEPGGPQVPMVACGPLLTVEEREDALAARERPAGDQNSLLIARGEVCGEEIASDSTVFVRIEPGDPADFEMSAELMGVAGEAVSGVGDDARWFAADGAGVLSVRQDTTLGMLHFRISIGRPDLDSVAQLAIATDLASRALGRFPGVEVVEPEPVTLVFERLPPDLATSGLADNLLAKEADGEWTRGEGIVATLGLMLGEADAGQVLPAGIGAPSGTGVISLAEEYLEDGPDATLRAEIEQLLERLVLSRDRLEAMAGLDEEPEAAAPTALIAAWRAQPADDCETLWFVVGPCLAVGVDPALDAMFGVGKYRVYYPSEDEAGWTFDHAAVAVDAMATTAKRFETLGTMPRVDIMFTPYGGAYALTDISHLDVACTINLNTPMQSLTPNQFSQWLANEMAHCLIGGEFPEQLAAGYEVTRWWRDGLSVYLSGVVYPGVNLEWLELPAALASLERETTLLDRASTNWLFFEYLHPIESTVGIFNLIRTLPTGGGRSAQEEALRRWSGIEGLYHLYAERMTDQAVIDLGGGQVPFVPDVWEIDISGPTVVLDEIRPFGVNRLQVTVASGQYACVEYDSSDQLFETWRPGDWGATTFTWLTELPEVLDGNAVFALTATDDGATFSMEVKDVSDEPDCEEESTPSGTSPPCSLECPPSRFYR